MSQEPMHEPPIRSEDHAGNPAEAQPGRGAPGDQYGVQMSQNPAVHPDDEVIPSNVNVGLNVKQVAAEAAQEKGSGMRTTDGYVIDESGKLDNFAVEPPMYTEKDGQRIELEPEKNR